MEDVLAQVVLLFEVEVFAAREHLNDCEAKAKQYD